MAALGRNIELQIYNADGTAFNNLVLHKFTVDSVIMSLGDKITGDVYYKDNSLAVTMQEYVVYNDVHYVLVSPPTIVREGLVSDNSSLNGMTKYSFVFYHPMYMLGNLPFSDVAVTQSEMQYLSENKTFSWCGTGLSFIDKINWNLEGTQWIAVTSGNVESLAKLSMLPSDIPTQKSTDQQKSNVLTFDNSFVSDALKTIYETWEVPFVIDSLHAGEYYDSSHVDYYTLGKKFVIIIGLPSNEIVDSNSHNFVFQFGQGVGLKNNSRTPKNNKIVTRIAGTGSERNIPYGYPQVRWYGTAGASFTYGDAAGVYENVTIGGHTFAKVVSYPIYKGILGGQYVELIKHPFTRTVLMPTVYSATLFNKISPYLSNGSVNTSYNPDTTLIEYYDADGSYPNPIVLSAPSYESHKFENIYPRLGSRSIAGAEPYDLEHEGAITYQQFVSNVNALINASTNENEKEQLRIFRDSIDAGMYYSDVGEEGGSYTWHRYLDIVDTYYLRARYTSSLARFDYLFVRKNYTVPPVQWDDSVDDEGNYNQSYFKITLPQLDFDMYACASITEQMNVVMRSGACIGCTFEISVDWDDYKSNFYLSDGTFDPVIHTTEGDGHVRDGQKYPNTSQGQVTVIVKKDLDTFGTLLPNIYQQPASGDEFVLTGISLPESYITNAQTELDSAARQYMLENNVHYYDYPLKFDEHFLTTHTDILSQIRNNTIVRFVFGGTTNVLYVKQITVKYGERPLPQYDITLTDDVEIVLNQIGQVTDDVSRMRVQFNELQKYYSESIIQELNSKLSRIVDDVCLGRITFQQGLDSIGSAIFHGEIRSPQFESGLYTGRGWKIDNLGNAELESLRVRSFLEVVELIINRLQAQEGDTIFSDNDQIDKVDVVVDETDGSVSYVLSLKEKWDGYVTSQMYGGILKGIINTLAAKQAGVSDESDNHPEDQGTDDGGNKYYTSWMRVVGTHNTDQTLGVNQIRVVLYGDNDVPAQKNFEPCELMAIARWGGFLDPNEEGISAGEKERRRRMQNVFYISTTEGRIVKLTAVNKPILENWNYGTTLGILPEFVKNMGNVRSRVIEGRDYLYAQGVVVGDFIQVDINGAPVSTVVFCGDWVNGSAIPNPSVGNGIYLKDEYNEQTQRYETHEVRHASGCWLCLQHQPVRQGGVDVYYEPKWNSPYWKLVDGNENVSIEFSSSRGFSFRRGAVDTVITAYLFYGNVDITNDVAAEFWSWTRHEEGNEDAQGHITYTQSDLAWNAQHQGQKTLHLTNEDMPSAWSSSNKAIFTCTVIVNDGQTTQTVQNQIIS